MRIVLVLVLILAPGCRTMSPHASQSMSTVADSRSPYSAPPPVIEQEESAWTNLKDSLMWPLNFLIFLK